jgi:hypothetical protein
MMPRRVYQPDIVEVDRCDFYTVEWWKANRDWGTFRCDPLKDNVGQGPRQVMNVIKAAYAAVKFRSFQECIDFCNREGIRICRHTKGDCQQLTAES